MNGRWPDLYRIVVALAVRALHPFMLGLTFRSVPDQSRREILLGPKPSPSRPSQAHQNPGSNPGPVRTFKGVSTSTPHLPEAF